MQESVIFQQLPNLVWGIRQCQSQPPQEADKCVAMLLRRICRGLGFHAFLSEKRSSTAASTRRLFFATKKVDQGLREILEKTLVQLDQQPDPGSNNYVLLEAGQGEPIEVVRSGNTIRLRAVGLRSLTTEELARRRQNNRSEGEETSPLKLALLVYDKGPAVAAGSAFLVTLAAEIDMALSFLDEMYLHFPPACAEHLWDAAWRKRTTPDPCKLFAGEPLNTVTLSLDLRQSTFAMDKVVRRDVFSRWIDGLVSVYRKLVNDHFGVFDKFTGDGVLAHFLYHEDMPGQDVPQDPTRRALYCAMEMIEATAIFCRRLQPILRVDSKRFGAGVGIAAEWAHWSLDATRSPIVVGHGVVDACRLCAEATAGDVLMTVNAFHSIGQDLSDQDAQIDKVPFSGKNYPDDLEIEIWRVRSGAAIFCDRYDEVCGLAAQVLNAIEELSVSGEAGVGRDRDCVLGERGGVMVRFGV